MSRRQGPQGQHAPPLNEQSLQALVETIPALVWRAKPDGHIDYVNKRLLDYLGSPLEEIIGWGWMKKVHPHDVAFKVQSWLSNLEAMSSHDAKCRFQGADGAYRWFDVRGEPLRDGAGRVQNWYGVLIDIDDQKKAEETSRESEYKLRKIIETMPGFHWSTGPDGEPTQVNQRVLDYCGLQFSDFLQLGWERFLHPDDFPATAKAFYDAIQTGTTYHAVHRLRRADGEYRWYHATGEPLRDRQGNIIEWYGLSVDIDENMRAQEALRESERSLRSAIDGIAGLVAVLTPNGEVETVNRQCLEYFGRSLENLGNWQFNDAVHPDDLPRILEIFKSAVASGIPFNYELRLRHLDGEYRWFDNRGVPIRDDSGRIARWYVLLTDIEDRTRALARLEQMQSDFAHMNRVSMMGELAASLSHEITQPIASARNNARAAQNFLDRQLPDLGEVREALNCVVGDTNRAGDIVDRIRDHIKKTPPRKERVDLNRAVIDVIALAQGAIGRNGISVQTRLAEGLPHVQADRVQVQQVVLNLILNAVEAMSLVKKGSRKLAIITEEPKAGGVLVAVCDSGPGIDPKNLDRVFDAFYTTKASGVGMGLSICRSIIHAHGGQLSAHVNPPRGAVFRFILPGADHELTSSFRPAQLTRKPYEDTKSDPAHRPAYEGSKRRRRSGPGRVPRRRDRQ